MDRLRSGSTRPPGATLGRARPPAVLLLLASLLPLAAGGCASFRTVKREFDSATGYPSSGPEPEAIRFSPVVDRYPPGARILEGTGLGGVVRGAFRLRPRPEEVRRPADFTRVRIRKLVEKAPGHAVGRSEAVVRLLFVAERDPRPLHRVDALQGLAVLVARLPRPEPAPSRAAADAAFRRHRDDVVEALQAGWPDRRGGTALAGDERERYVAALHAAARLPWGEPAEHRLLLRALAAGARLERDRRLRRAAVAALEAAMAAAAADALWQGTRDSEPAVREEAVRALAELHGPGILPRLLAHMAAAPRVAATPGRGLHEPDAFVRRRLLHLAAGLDLETASRGNPSVLHFLQACAVGDEDPGLRMVAQGTLARLLGREVAFDPGWVSEWWREHVLSKEASGSGGP